jgi:hypothetical protein
MTVSRTQNSDLSEAASSALAKVRAAKRPRSKSFLHLVHFSDSRDIGEFRPTYSHCIWSDTVVADNDRVRKITSSQRVGEYTAIYVAKIGLLTNEDPATCKYVSGRAKGKIGTEYGLRVRIPRKNFKKIDIRYNATAQIYELDT